MKREKGGDRALWKGREEGRGEADRRGRVGDTGRKLESTHAHVVQFEEAFELRRRLSKSCDFLHLKRCVNGLKHHLLRQKYTGVQQSKRGMLGECSTTMTSP
jgi:hypothetical protein